MFVVDDVVEKTQQHEAAVVVGVDLVHIVDVADVVDGIVDSPDKEQFGNQ